MSLSAVEAAFTSAMILAIGSGALISSGGIVKQETIDIHSQRIENTALAIQSFPAGNVKLEMTGYKFKVEDKTVMLKYGSATSAASLEGMGIEVVEGPGSFKKVSGTLCVVKKPADITSIAIETGC